MNGLLIDDDELYARTLQPSLARRGIDTRIALDAGEALRLAREQAPDFTQYLRHFPFTLPAPWPVRINPDQAVFCLPRDHQEASPRSRL